MAVVEQLGAYIYIATQCVIQHASPGIRTVPKPVPGRILKPLGDQNSASWSGIDPRLSKSEAAGSSPAGDTNSLRLTCPQ